LDARLKVTKGNLSTPYAVASSSAFGGDFEDQGCVVLQAGFASGANRAEWGSVQFWVRSSETAASVQKITCGTGPAPYRVGSISTGVPTYPSNMPTSNSPDVCMVEDVTGAVADIIGAGKERPWVNDSLVVTKKIKISSVERVPISYVQCRSAGIRQLYTGQTLKVSDDSLRAQQGVRGSTHTKIANKTQENYDRRRLIAWGPPGYFPPERTEAWPALMPVRFRGVQSNASAGIESCLLQGAVEWRRNGGKMYVAMHVLAIYHGNSANNTVGRSEWELSVSFERPDASDTDYSTPDVLASKTVTNSIPTFTSSVADADVAPPLLLTRRWLYGTIFRGTGSWAYALRDGQLFEDDFPLLTTVVVEVDASSLTPGTLGMLRVDADYQTGTLEEFPPSTTTPAALGRDLELVCTGWSVYQGGV